MSTLPLRRKHATRFAARSGPVVAAIGRDLFLAWKSAETETITLARTGDLTTFDEPMSLDFRTLAAPALVAGWSSLLLAWVDCDTREVTVIQEEEHAASPLRWGAPVRLPLRTDYAPSLAFADGRFWVAIARQGDNRLLLTSSTDGEAWEAAAELNALSATAPALVNSRDGLLVSWNDAATGHLMVRPVAPQAARAAETITDGPLTDHTLSEQDGKLFAAWSDAATGMIRVASRLDDGTWEVCSAVTERAIEAPALAFVGGKLALAWTRDDSPDLDGRGRINVAVSEPADGPANSHTFTGNVQGHPTVLDPLHHTSYPYLGLIVLPSDLQMPKGQTVDSLITDMSDKLTQRNEFWAEVSYGQVDLSSFDVYPQVIPLPSPIETYIVRKRPKILDGFGATFPVDFAGGETLEIYGAANFAATITFEAGQKLSLNEIVAKINDEINKAPYAGPKDAKPIAYGNGQLSILTTSYVDPGTVLNVGGTAIDMLGLGQGDLTVYEGHTKQEKHLDQLLTDALQAVVAGEQDPLGYLKRYSGVALAIATNNAWWTLRPEGTTGTTSLTVVPGQDNYVVMAYWTTTAAGPDTDQHETGHNLGFPDLYEEGSRLVGAEPGGWDVMADGNGSHPTAWLKSYQSKPKDPSARWMTDDHIAVLSPLEPSLEVIVIPSESPFPAANPFEESHEGVPVCHAIKIPLDDNHAFFVENRQKGPYTDPRFGTVNFSANLPGEGLIVTDAVNDKWTTGLPRSNVVMVQPADFRLPTLSDAVLDEVFAQGTKEDKLFVLAPFVAAGQISQANAEELASAETRDDMNAILRRWENEQVLRCYPLIEVGKEIILYQFPDGSGDSRVKLLEIIGDQHPRAYKVKATWGRQGNWFDLEIRKWSPPPYDSPDIWIDSQENGWDSYLHHNARLEPALAGNPILNGDRPWIGHDNRVYARIWNHGNIAQNNVKVTFEVVVPPGLSTGYPFDYDYVNIPAGGSAIASGTWRPLETPPNEHGCISATVAYKPWNLEANEPGELNADNNSAQENIGDFYVESGSPYAPVAVPFEFANPLPFDAEMRIDVQGLKRGWLVTASPYQFRLAPGERIEGEAILEALEYAPLEDPKEGKLAPVISIQALVQTGCTWERVGGFSMIAHAVCKASIHAVAESSAEAVYVMAQASTADGPIAGANVAMRVIGPRKETLSVETGTTDQAGRIHRLIPIALAHAANQQLVVEVRLSPFEKAGPATDRVAFGW